VVVLTAMHLLWSRLLTSAFMMHLSGTPLRIRPLRIMPKFEVVSESILPSFNAAMARLAALMADTPFSGYPHRLTNNVREMSPSTHERVRG